MAYGGSKVGNNDPDSIAAGAISYPELSPEELLELNLKFAETIGKILFEQSTVETTDPASILELARRYQVTDDADFELQIVQETLTNNGGMYDNEIEGVIKVDPIVVALRKSQGQIDATKAIRLRRSILAISELLTRPDL